MLLAALCSMTAACAISPGGPPAVYMSITVAEADGTTTHPPLCTQFPVLVGSRVVDRQEIPEDLIVRVELSRDRADVTLVGTERTTVTYSLAQIEGGVSGDPIEVAGQHRDYEVTVRSGCP